MGIRMMNFKQKGQNFVEYSALLALVIAALLAMQIYMKRSIEGRLKEAADGIGSQYDPIGTTGVETISYNRTDTTYIGREGTPSWQIVQNPVWHAWSLELRASTVTNVTYSSERTERDSNESIIGW